MSEGTVIIESSLKRGGKRAVWVASQLNYKKSSEGVYLSRPHVLSVDDDRQRGRLEAVLAAIIEARGAYFEQVMNEVQEREKEEAK